MDFELGNDLDESGKGMLERLLTATTLARGALVSQTNIIMMLCYRYSS